MYRGRTSNYRGHACPSLKKLVNILVILFEKNMTGNSFLCLTGSKKCTSGLLPVHEKLLISFAQNFYDYAILELSIWERKADSESEVLIMKVGHGNFLSFFYSLTVT